MVIKASDVDNMMTAEVEIETTDEGDVAIPASMLLEVLGTFPEQPLTFHVKDDTTIEIISAQGNYVSSYVSAEEFPRAAELQEPSTTTIPGSVLSSAISNTLFATGNDELRAVMNGVLFEFSEECLKFVGTDAHKLVKYQRDDIKANAMPNS